MWYWNFANCCKHINCTFCKVIELKSKQLRVEKLSAKYHLFIKVKSVSKRLYYCILPFKYETKQATWSKMKKRIFFFDRWCIFLNPLSANPTKWPNTHKQFVGCCLRYLSYLSVVDHFVRLAFKVVMSFCCCFN